jgi:hypothetical protein
MTQVEAAEARGPLRSIEEQPAHTDHTPLDRAALRTAQAARRTADARPINAAPTRTIAASSRSRGYSGIARCTATGGTRRSAGSAPGAGAVSPETVRNTNPVSAIDTSRRVTTLSPDLRQQPLRIIFIDVGRRDFKRYASADVLGNQGETLRNSIECAFKRVLTAGHYPIFPTRYLAPPSVEVQLLNMLAPRMGQV